MKTEVTKHFKWGFLLSEQELRRVVQRCQEHFAKIKDVASNVRRMRVVATLDDGAIVESQSIDDILSLENRGSKQVNQLTIRIDDGSDESQWLIAVEFSDAEKSPASWISASFKVVGLSRDWAFLAASEIEESLKSIRLFSWIYLVQSRWFVLLPLFLGSIIFLLLLSYFRTNDLQYTLAQLEGQHKAGLLKDPVDAILRIEKAKMSEETASKTVPLALIGYALPGLIVFAFAKISPWLFPAYNFYWGYRMGIYDKKKARANVIWTVVVLGLIVSLAAIAIDRYFFK